jgi:hypothetical protein
MNKRILMVIVFAIPALASCESPVDFSMPAPHAECWGSMGCPASADWPRELPVIPVPSP